MGVDPKGLVFTKIARDGVCIITNKANPVTNLTQESVEGIFTGRIRDWSEVQGAKITGPIDLFDRDGASGTQDAFQHIFLGEYLKISPSATAKTSNGLEQNAVSADKQAIGFVSFAYTSGVNAVGYQGVACNLRNARSGQYTGVRNFWMVTKGEPKGEVAKYIKWVTKNGNKIDQKHHQLELDRDPLAGVPSRLSQHAGRASAAVRTDKRAERTLGALAFGVLALIVAMVVTVFDQGVAVVLRTTGCSWFGPGGNVEAQLRAMREATPLPGHSIYYFRGWPLIWGTLITTVPGGDHRARSISTLAAIFLTEFAPQAGAAHAGTGDQAAGGRALDHLWLDRNLGVGAVDQRTPDLQCAQAVGDPSRAAQRREPRGRRHADPRGDDHPDHDRADRGGAGVGAGVLARGIRGARRKPLAHDRARLAAHRTSGDRRRDGARNGARARRGDHARRWSRAAVASLPTRSTA